MPTYREVCEGFWGAGFGGSVPPRPENRNASEFRVVNDVISPEGMHGPDLLTLFPYLFNAGPEGDGVMIDPPDPSLTQGLGRSPGQQWPSAPIALGVNPALPFEAVFDGMPTPIPLAPHEPGFGFGDPSALGQYGPTLHPEPAITGEIGEPAPLAEPQKQSWTEALMAKLGIGQAP